MSKIGPKNSTPEITIRRLVHSMGYRFRLHRKGLPGSPDLVFPKYKKVIFIHGCFWHGCRKCSRSNLPKTNSDFWQKKIGGNKKRDRKNYRELKKLGWDHLVIWQCEIQKMNYSAILKTITNFLQ